jgi:cytochrome bd-type quinol oxidase subunit 1
VVGPPPSRTAWHLTGRPEYLRATRFFGKLFLINFAMGVVTGSSRSSSSG